MSEKKILIIDDDQLYISMTRQNMERLGYLVVEAKSGEEGISLAKKEKPDLILLDIIMSGLNGFEVTRRLKQDSETAGIPIIVLTAINDPRGASIAAQSGAIDFIPKPFEGKLLAEKIEKIIGPGR